MSERVIFHIDVNSAFLSWTAVYRKDILGETEDIRELPAIIGGDQESRHGIVLAKSIAAKKYGIHTGEAIMAAKKKCPGLRIFPPDYHLYVSASRALIELLQSCCDQVTQYSIDEAWAEFSGFEDLYGPCVSFAHDLKDRIQRELGFTVNIGISTNRLLSKMAGEFSKPNKVHTLFPEEIPKKMWPLSVDHLFFAGSASVNKLHTLGIYTIGELAKSDPVLLKSHMKNQGEVLWNYANGNDLIPYVYQHVSNKGYGNGITAPRDVTQSEEAKHILLSLSETVAMRIRMDHVKITGVAVSITGNDFSRSSMQMQLYSQTDITSEIYEGACILFDRLWDSVTPIRQLNVHTFKVTTEAVRQYNLFETTEYEKNERVDRTIDSIRGKYGEDAVFRASFLGSRINHVSGGLDKERRTGITVGLDLGKEQGKGRNREHDLI